MFFKPFSGENIKRDYTAMLSRVHGSLIVCLTIVYINIYIDLGIKSS